MAAAAGTVVLLTGIPIAGLLIIDGALRRHPGEVLAGLAVVIVIGLPLLVRDAVHRWWP